MKASSNTKIIFYLVISFIGLGIFLELSPGIQKFIFLVMLSGGLFYLFGYPAIKKQRILTENKYELEKRNSQIREFASSKNFQYVSMFVTKYPKNDFPETELINLQALLKMKGTILDISVLKEVIRRTIKNNEYIDFENRLLGYHSQDTHKITRYFLNLYGDNYESFLPYFRRFLIEHKLASNSINIKALVEHIKRTIELESFEQRIRSTESTVQKNIDDVINEIDQMTGEEFEVFLGKLFTKMGYRVEYTPTTGDQGADLIIQKHGKRLIVQAKRYSGKVNNKAVQEVIAAVNYFNGDEGIVVTNNYYTHSALKLAKGTNIKLVNREQLKQLIEEHF